MNKKVYIETYGCQMNVADSKSVLSILQLEDFASVTDVEEADIIIINTCSVRDNAEQKIWHRLDFLKGLKRRQKNIKVGIIGCMAQVNSDNLLKHVAVDFVAGPDAYRSLPELISKTYNNTKTSNVDFNINETYCGIEQYKNNTNEISGFIPITRGCNNFCSYCIVPYTRGRERSSSYKDIIKSVLDFKNNNYKEITLLGQNVNSYYFEDKNKKVDFPELIKMVAEKAPELRIRFTTSHPKDISDRLIETIAQYDNICNHIHLPVQSGSNKILKLMNRKYTREWYLDRVNKIKSTIPNCGLSSDIFCGFSDESETDFEQTMDLIRTVKYDSAFMFKYSVRPGTFAANKLIDNVPEKIKIKRLNNMIKVQNQISLENNKKDIGKSFEVLIEGKSKRSDKEYFGRTQQNKVVVFPSKGLKINQLAIVNIKEVSSATLKGE